MKPAFPALRVISALTPGATWRIIGSAYNTGCPRVTRAKINELLRERHQRYTPLQRLLRQAANQESWTAQFRALLPGSLQRDCQVVGVRGATVLVNCRNAASATKLRFLAPELLATLSKLASFHAAKEIRIRVSTEEL